MKNISRLKNKLIPVNRPKVFPEDIASVSTNELISDELDAEVEAFIEKNTFRS